MAGKSSGDRRKGVRGKGGKPAAPAKQIRVGVIDYKDVQTHVIEISSQLGLVQAHVGTMDERLHQVESDLRAARDRERDQDRDRERK